MTTPITSSQQSLPEVVVETATESSLATARMLEAEGGADRSVNQALVGVAQGALSQMTGTVATAANFPQAPVDVGSGEEIWNPASVSGANAKTALLAIPGAGVFSEGAPATSLELPLTGGSQNVGASVEGCVFQGVMEPPSTPSPVSGTIPEPALKYPVANKTEPVPSGASDTGSSTGETDLEKGMSSLQQKDPTLFAKMMKDAKSGNGNELVKDELQAYKEGTFTKQQAIAAVSGAQKLANNNGGGKINGTIRNEAKDVLGGGYIKGGQTRIGHAIVKALESFTPIGAIAKGVQGRTSKQNEDVLTAAQPAMQQGTQKAMQDMDSVDPELAQKFQLDLSKGDGNAMVDDMVALKNEENSGGTPNVFSDQDAQLLGSQVGSFGKGKVNAQKDQEFSGTFGVDTLYQGSSRGTKGFDKFENAVGGIMQSLTAPVTSAVAGVDDLVHGNIGGFFSELGDVVKGVATDAMMFVMPEAAPEVIAGEVVARGGADIAGASTGMSDIGKILGQGANTTNNILNYSSDVNNIIGAMEGGGTQNDS